MMEINRKNKKFSFAEARFVYEKSWGERIGGAIDSLTGADEEVPIAEVVGNAVEQVQAVQTDVAADVVGGAGEAPKPGYAPVQPAQVAEGAGGAPVVAPAEEAAPKPEEGPDPVAEAQALQAELAKQTEQAGAAHDAGAERAQTRTGIELASLGVDIQNQLKISVDLNGLAIPQPLDASLNVAGVKDAMVAAVTPRINDAAVATAMTLLQRANLPAENITNESVKALLVDLSATNALMTVEKLFKPGGKYERMKDFLAKKQPPYRALSYRLSYGVGNLAEIAMISDPATLDEDYKKFVEDPANKPAAVDNAADGSPDSAEAARAAEAAKVLKGSFVGRTILPMFAGLLGVPVDEKGNITDEGYEAIVRGDAGVLGAIVQAFGGGGLILDGQDHLGDFLGGLNPEHKAMVEKWIPKAEGSFFSLKGASEKFAGVAAASLAGFSENQFGSLLANAGINMPEGGFSLTEAFTKFADGKGAQISLKSGAEMLLPAGSKITILKAGQEVLKEATNGPLKLDSGLLQIISAIPSGTKFTGPIDFGWFDKPSA